MPCPTCEHVMHTVTAGVYWCPRCGTLRQGQLHDAAPKLVSRVAELREKAVPAEIVAQRFYGTEQSELRKHVMSVKAAFKILGVDEAIGHQEPENEQASV